MKANYCERVTGKLKYFGMLLRQVEKKGVMKKRLGENLENSVMQIRGITIEGSLPRES